MSPERTAAISSHVEVEGMVLLFMMADDGREFSSVQVFSCLLLLRFAFVEVRWRQEESDII